MAPSAVWAFFVLLQPTAAVAVVDVCDGDEGPLGRQDATEDASLHLLQRGARIYPDSISGVREEFITEQELVTYQEAVGLPSSTPQNNTLKYRQRMRNNWDLDYTATVKVGGQDVQGILDTGSFEFVLLDKDCETCGATGEYYSKHASETYIEGILFVTESYGSGDLATVEGFDTVQIGPYSVANQSMWVTYSANMEILDGSFGAIIGVGPASSARKTMIKEADWVLDQASAFTDAGLNVPRPLQKLSRIEETSMERARGKLSFLESLGISEFSVCLGRRSLSPGYWIWNDDERMKNPSAFIHIPVVGNMHRGIQIMQAHLEPQGDVNTEDVLEFGCHESCGAIIDSGTSLLSLPQSQISKIMDMLASFNYDCSRIHEMPDLVFTVGEKQLHLPAHSYVGQTFESSTPWYDILLPFTAHVPEVASVCEPLVIPTNEMTRFGELWILGAPFLREYYTTFSRTSSLSYTENIYVAPAGDGCLPQASHVAGFAQTGAQAKRPARQPLRVDKAKLRAPQWAIDKHLISVRPRGVLRTSPAANKQPGAEDTPGQAAVKEASAAVPLA